MQHAANGFAHRRVCAVAAHHIVGSHRAGAAPVHADGVFEGDGHRVVLRGGVDRQAHNFPAVIGRQARGRVLHHLQKQLMQTRLVDQDVRHLRAVICHVLHPPNAVNVVGVLGVWHPEGGLVHPIGFALDLVGKPKSLEHLHGAGVDAIGLALDDVAGHALDDHGLDLRELRQLRGQAQAGRPCTGDQHIDFFWQGLMQATVAAVGRGGLDVRVTASETIFIKLHHASPNSEISVKPK